MIEKLAAEGICVDVVSGGELYIAQQGGMPMEKIYFHGNNKTAAELEQALDAGDYVLSGGEAAALVMIEAIARLRPGVLGNPDSVIEESHGASGLLEQEVYTRPVAWRGLDVSRGS